MMDFISTQQQRFLTQHMKPLMKHFIDIRNFSLPKHSPTVPKDSSSFRVLALEFEEELRTLKLPWIFSGL